MNYTVKDIKLWGVSKGSTNLTNAKKTETGEYLMSLVLDGQTEPIDYRSIVVPEIGEVIKGELKTYTSSSGTERTFLAVDNGEIPNQKYIQAQWAIGQALIYAPDHEDFGNIEDYARGLIEVVNKIAEGEQK